MEGRSPQESFPQIGTVDDPAIFYEGRNLLVCYEVAPASDGGAVILKFSDVVFVEQNPNNVPEGLQNAKHPVKAWEFTEVSGSEHTERWPTRRFWTISFNDMMVEIVFSNVRQVHRTHDSVSPGATLLDYLATGHQREPSER